MKKHFFTKRSNRKKIWFLVSHHGQICFLFCSVFNHDASLLFCKSVLSRYFLWKINVVFRMLKKTIWQLLYQFFSFYCPQLNSISPKKWKFPKCNIWCSIFIFSDKHQIFLNWDCNHPWTKMSGGNTYTNSISSTSGLFSRKIGWFR